MDKYTKRLLDEWRKYGKIIIAVDYDSTISYWPSIDNKEDIERVIKTLQVADNTGAYIVIFTACKSDRHLDIQKHCESFNLNISGINTSPIDLPYGNTSKIYANIFLDDRAGLLQALDSLELAMYTIRGEKHSKLSEGGVA